VIIIFKMKKFITFKKHKKYILTNFLGELKMVEENTNNETFEEKVNDNTEKGKKFANQVANDFGKYLDEFKINLKSAQKSIDDKINEYTENNVTKIEVDLIEDENNFYLKAAIPGVRKETIDIEMTENAVFISCEFKPFSEEFTDLEEEYSFLIKNLPSGKSKRKIELPQEVDVNNIKAKYNNGLVFMDIPKVEVQKYKVDLD